VPPQQADEQRVAARRAGREQIAGVVDAEHRRIAEQLGLQRQGAGIVRPFAQQALHLRIVGAFDGPVEIVLRQSPLEVLDAVQRQQRLVLAADVRPEASGLEQLGSGLELAAHRGRACEERLGHRRLSGFHRFVSTH